MQYGAHLPVVDLDDHGWPAGSLASDARTARDLGYRALSSNDHLVFTRPWLDGIVALASVVEASGRGRPVAAVQADPSDRDGFGIAGRPTPATGLYEATTRH